MIQIKLSKHDFEYDIRSLVKAFYPKEEIIFDECSMDSCIILFLIKIDLTDKKIGISFEQNEVPIFHGEAEASYSNSGRKIYKNVLKRLLYNALNKMTDRELPWGTLTGIRPTKLIMEKLENHSHPQEILQYMSDEYLCSKEKAELSLEIAEREYNILSSIDYKNGFSIYIGIPFCPTTCLYCSFTSYSIETYAHMAEPYLDALYQEIDFVSEALKHKRITTVYIGGGTPTTLSAKQLDRLLGKVKESFSFETVLEFTVEAGRPDSITKEKLHVLKQHGVTRISINPQTMNQGTLDVIGRKHSIEQVKDAFYMAREAGHNNINMDLILGLPGEKVSDVTNTMKEVVKLSPESLTVHTLSIKRAAYLNIYKDKYEMLIPEDTAEMLRVSSYYAGKEGYLPYYLYRQKNIAENLENIGYSKAGKEGIYNILIMEELQSIFAIGAGGASKFVFPNREKVERVENVKSVKDYVERIDEMLLRKAKYLEQNSWIL